MGFVQPWRGGARGAAADVAQDGRALRHASAELQADREVVLAAMLQNCYDKTVLLLGARVRAAELQGAREFIRELHQRRRALTAPGRVRVSLGVLQASVAVRRRASTAVGQPVAAAAAAAAAAGGAGAATAAAGGARCFIFVWRVARWIRLLRLLH